MFPFTNEMQVDYNCLGSHVSFPSCQVSLSFSALACQLLLEVFQRRAFLKLHTMHTPGHKNWPIGDVQGVLTCLGIAASLLFSCAVFWQATVLSSATYVI
jgi:hypothetical protein